jgi:hypothetical protein
VDTCKKQIIVFILLPSHCEICKEEDIKRHVCKAVSWAAVLVLRETLKLNLVFNIFHTKCVVVTYFIKLLFLYHLLKRLSDYRTKFNIHFKGREDASFFFNDKKYNEVLPGGEDYRCQVDGKDSMYKVRLGIDPKFILHNI